MSLGHAMEIRKLPIRRSHFESIYRLIFDARYFMDEAMCFHERDFRFMDSVLLKCARIIGLQDYKVTIREYDTVAISCVADRLGNALQVIYYVNGDFFDESEINRLKQLHQFCLMCGF